MIEQQLFKFTQYCKLTCLGGLELGQCLCDGINTCQLSSHPDFESWMAKAIKRMERRWLKEWEPK